jgi:hypothetical protein
VPVFATVITYFQLLNFKARYAKLITAAEMKYMRRTAGYTWTDYKTNTQIAKDLKITRLGQITGIQEKLDTTRK